MKSVHYPRWQGLFVCFITNLTTLSQKSHCRPFSDYWKQLLSSSPFLVLFSDYFMFLWVVV